MFNKRYRILGVGVNCYIIQTRKFLRWITLRGVYTDVASAQDYIAEYLIPTEAYNLWDSKYA